MNLSKIIQPNLNIARSINLNRDYRKKEPINEYLITSKTIEILGRFADSLEGEKVNAWSLTGPYGMGKSAFVNYLLSVAGPASDPFTRLALEKIKDTDIDLYKRLSTNIQRNTDKEGFFRVPVTASYESINSSLAKGLHKAIGALKIKGKRKIQATLNGMLENNAINSGALFKLFSEIRDKLGRPILLVIDEFGKNLDFMSTHYDQGDIFIIQQLAEMDSVFLWVCLHQAFDGYASGLSSLQRREWGKVQGRFEDISFIESMSQMLYLMEKALHSNFNNKYGNCLKDWAGNVAGFIKQTDAINKSDFTVDKIKGIYPLHPVTAIALIELCTRFAQNDRTLLSFLCNNDRLALRSFLENTSINGNNGLPAVGLDYLYDYFFNISITAYINRADSQRWIEIHDVINSNANLPEIEHVILKTVGVLNLLPGSLGLKADGKTIVNVVGQTRGVEKDTIQKGLDNLAGRGMLLYRKYASEFRIWEGSDFNIQEAISNKRNKLEVGKLEHILQKYLPLPPIIASRHSYQTGTIRRFERKWLAEEALDASLTPQEGFDGLILYCFGTLKEPRVKPAFCADKRPLVIAYVSSQAILKEFALDVAASRAVFNESRELKHDSAARKEVKFRIRTAEDNFRLYLEQAFAPGSEKVNWYVMGEKVPIKNTKALSTVLSDLCNVCYNDCPPIRNEMISYEKLSGAASRARRILVEAMVTSEEKECLGLQGFGPEVAIYRSLLLSEGLHVKNEQTGYWQFALGPGGENRYEALWKKIDRCLNEEKEGIAVEEILNILKEPPFGFRQGPAPIYVVLYLIVHSETVAVFQEGSYRPYLSAAEVALMLKRPDLFTLKKYIFTDIDQAVFNTYRNLLKTVHIEDKPGLRNANLIGVVGPLVNFIENLPDYTKSTRRLSKEARNVRIAIQNSEDPARLIFKDLPAAVGVKVDVIENILKDRVFQEKLYAALSELLEFFPDLYKKIQNVVSKAFNGETLNEIMKNQSSRVEPLIDICGDRELKQFLAAVNRKIKDADEWVKGIAGVVMGKPIESWNDNDLSIFEARLNNYADQVNSLEALDSVKSKQLRDSTKVVSMMAVDGSIKRAVIENVKEDKEKVMGIVSNLESDRRKIQALLLVLMEKLLKDVDNEPE